MNFKIIIFAVLLAGLSGRAIVSAAPVSDIAAIRAELIQMANDDQRVRSGTIDMVQMWEIDTKNIQQLKKIIQLIGWPTKKLVGEKASRGAFLVAQHAANDLPFMEEALGYIEIEYKKKQVPPLNYAMIYDRVEMLHGRPQKYGTQFLRAADGCRPHKLIKAEKVDEYRAQMGLDSLAAALRRACK
jgi:hypothetical protein